MRRLCRSGIRRLEAGRAASSCPRYWLRARRNFAIVIARRRRRRTPPVSAPPTMRPAGTMPATPAFHRPGAGRRGTVWRAVVGVANDTTSLAAHAIATSVTCDRSSWSPASLAEVMRRALSAARENDMAVAPEIVAILDMCRCSDTESARHRCRRGLCLCQSLCRLRSGEIGALL